MRFAVSKDSKKAGKTGWNRERKGRDGRWDTDRPSASPQTVAMPEAEPQEVLEFSIDSLISFSGSLI